MFKALFTLHTFKSLTKRVQMNMSMKQEFMQMLSKKQYKQILGLSDDYKDMFKEKDLHRAYLNQVKKYHSDNVQSEQAKKEFQQITKCIISAYDQIKKQDNKFKKTNNDENFILHDQDEIAQKLFRKNYHQIKYSMYQSGNQKMRAQFLQELQKLKKSKRAQNNQQPNTKQDNQQQGSNYRSTYNPSSTVSATSDNSGAKFLGLAAICALLSLPLFLSKDKKGDILQMKKEHEVKQYKDKDYDIMELNSQKILMKPFEEFYNSILKRRPHMLVYPGKDPHILQQLTKYSVAPDIHIYEVPSKYFLDHAQYNKIQEANTTDFVQKYQLTETKPNTLLTLSLEAQRTLHNVYISVDDILSEIKQTGKFTPPKIFFKFHGYLMFQIRNKPFSTLQCYRNTKYISLFDLYFDFYSPIFFRRDHFRQYLAGFEEDSPIKNNRYFGNVYLNYRAIPKVYLQKGKKVVIMKDIKKAYNSSSLLKSFQQQYREDWQGYYARFEKNWKQYCKHQKQGEIVY